MRLVCAILILCLCGGCEYKRTNLTVTANGRVPRINPVEKPVLENMNEAELNEFSVLSPGLRAKLIRNDTALKSYSEQMAVSIKIFNEYADRHNADADAAIGITAKKE